ncbi:hypothetical protein GPECTOR_36g136 [Gonium pectorale]|uniref:Uncharacterized protein n=1 Tax=Gonium pectorale TaxID=33097 RepID=A0A150GCJ2_GONPE|nr:hypothetical protein GPECTOR_36g136 [Gonium pectorale]|eukprot:KXZ47285.1 hypothetical protein GPECTOR_36g136 [Gonium pectorale]
MAHPLPQPPPPTALDTPLQGAPEPGGARPSFDPFTRLSGAPGLGWADRGGGGSGIARSGSASLHHHTSATAASGGPSTAAAAHSAAAALGLGGGGGGRELPPLVHPLAHHPGGASSPSSLSPSAAGAAGAVGLPSPSAAPAPPPSPPPPAHLVLPAPASLGSYDQLSLALALECGGGGGGGSRGGAGGEGGVGGGGAGGGYEPGVISRLLGSVLSTLAAMDSGLFTVRMVLRVAAEQHGVFALPAMRAALRVANPSPALMAALCQTNTYFAVEPHRNAIMVRKPPGDIVKLLLALHATLPVRDRGGNGLSGGLSSVSAGGGDMGVAVLARGRNGAPGSHAAHPGAVGGLRSGRASADFGSRPGSTTPGPHPRHRGSLELIRPGTSGGAGATAHAPLAPPPPLTPGGVSYSHGTPYSQLERLFPGWHMHVVELSPPGVMVEEF